MSVRADTDVCWHLNYTFNIVDDVRTSVDALTCRVDCTLERQLPGSHFDPLNFRFWPRPAVREPPRDAANTPATAISEAAANNTTSVPPLPLFPHPLVTAGAGRFP